MKQEEYDHLETAMAEPEAGSLMVSMRSYGYNLPTAVADLTDNAISAGASSVSVHFVWRGADSLLYVRDDGRGMSDKEITEAMRLGTGGLSVRQQKDLGRFGLGMKAASFSQCRKLTVISKCKNGAPSFWTWDLDFVTRSNQWKLVRIRPSGELLGYLEGQASGTIVLWEGLDRLVKDFSADNSRHLDRFLKAAGLVKQHLAMVFHRYLEKDRICISVNDRPVSAWDPFLRGEKATRSFPEEPLAGGKIIAKAFVLPHYSKITPPVYEQAGGPGGWNAQQGFYIYRKERLILAGDWLGMFRKEKHTDLARIMVDIPDLFDNEWQIDVRKSFARPPALIMDELRRIAGYTKSQAEIVYRHRGKVLQRSLKSEFSFVWQEKVRHNRRFYEINRDHPFIRSLLSSGDSGRIQSLLRLLEETIPVPLIVLNAGEIPADPVKPFTDAGSIELQAVARLVYESLIINHSPEEARNILLLTEPFNEYPALIDQIQT